MDYLMSLVWFKHMDPFNVDKTFNGNRSQGK